MLPRSRFALPLLLALVAMVCVRLGIWQVHRLRQRRAFNVAALAARAAPAIDLDTVIVSSTDAGSADLAGRRARAAGRYDRTHEIVLRGMTFDGAPGVQVVTPLLLPNGGAVLVKRGFVPAPDAVSAQLDGLDEPGAVSVRGIALPLERGGNRGAPLTHDGRTTWRALDLTALRSRLPYPVLSVYIHQTPDAALPPVPRRLPLAALDDGPHLSYALQWFGFATTALIVAAIVAFKSPAKLPPVMPDADRPAPR